MVIDFHVHCFADEIAQRAVESLSRTAGIPPRSDGTVAGIRTSMKKAGIDKSVILSIATKPQQTSKINLWAESVQSDDIIAFGTLHPEYEAWEDEMDRMHESGIKGIKFHPDYQMFFVDDPAMFPVYEKAAGLGLILLFHAGVDIGYPPPYHCTPERMRKVAGAIPGAKLVAAHMGGYDYWDEVEQYLAGEDIFFDTSYSLHKMNSNQFSRILSKHGYERILFATDSPWGDQSEEVGRISQMRIDDCAKEAILGGNAAKLLGLTC